MIVANNNIYILLNKKTCGLPFKLRKKKVSCVLVLVCYMQTSEAVVKTVISKLPVSKTYSLVPKPTLILSQQFPKFEMLPQKIEMRVTDPVTIYKRARFVIDIKDEFYNISLLKRIQNREQFSAFLHFYMRSVKSIHKNLNRQLTTCQTLELMTALQLDSSMLKTTGTNFLATGITVDEKYTIFKGLRETQQSDFIRLILCPQTNPGVHKFYMALTGNFHHIWTIRFEQMHLQAYTNIGNIVKEINEAHPELRLFYNPEKNVVDIMRDILNSTEIDSKFTNKIKEEIVCFIKNKNFLESAMRSSRSQFENDPLTTCYMNQKQFLQECTPETLNKLLHLNDFGLHYDLTNRTVNTPGTPILSTVEPLEPVGMGAYEEWRDYTVDLVSGEVKTKVKEEVVNFVWEKGRNNFRDILKIVLQSAGIFDGGLIGCLSASEFSEFLRIHDSITPVSLAEDVEIDKTLSSDRLDYAQLLDSKEVTVPSSEERTKSVGLSTPSLAPKTSE